MGVHCITKPDTILVIFTLLYRKIQLASLTFICEKIRLVYTLKETVCTELTLAFPLDLLRSFSSLEKLEFGVLILPQLYIF